MKITISLPKQLITKSKRYAFSKGATLSGLIRMLLQRELSASQIKKDANRGVNHDG